jgi:hypothetical protein
VGPVGTAKREVSPIVVRSTLATDARTVGKGKLLIWTVPGVPLGDVPPVRFTFPPAPDVRPTL